MKMKPHHHWQLQRLSALFLAITLPLLGVFLLTLKGASYHQTLKLVSHPAISPFLGLVIAVSLYHAVLGLQVVIRDYLRDLAAKVALSLVYIVTTLLMATTVYSLMGIMTR